MNDFTKKELIAIEDAMKDMLDIHTPQDGKSSLLNKIQSMIDNYCEYKINKDNPMYKCIRCGSKDIHAIFKIKYGLHDWLLCNDCGSQLYEFVIDKNADNGCSWSKTHFKRKYGNTV